MYVVENPSGDIVVSDIKEALELLNGGDKRLGYYNAMFKGFHNKVIEIDVQEIMFRTFYVEESLQRISARTIRELEIFQ